MRLRYAFRSAPLAPLAPRTPHTPLAILALIVAVFVTVGCSGPSLAERGDANLDRGNYELAASNYEAALVKDPDDDELRAKYRRARRLAVEANMEEARLAMAEGAWEDTIYSAERALQWGSERSDVRRFASGIESRVADEVRRRATDGAYASAVELAALGEDHLGEAYSRQISNARGDAIAGWKRWLLSEADDAAERGAIATEAVFLAEAARVTGDSAIRGRAQRSLDAVRSQYIYRMSVYSGRNRGSEVLAKMPPAIGSSSVVKGRLNEADFAVEVEFTNVDIYDDIVTDVRSKRYVSDHIRRKNPEWIHLRRHVRRLEHELEDAEIELARAESLYESRPNARNKAALEATETRVDLLEDRLRDREHDLFRADEYIREPVYSVHRWEVQTVTRTARGEVTLRWVDPATGRENVVTEPIQLVERDRSQPGFHAADVPRDPLELSSVSAMGDQLTVDAAGEVVTLLEETYAAHVNEVAAQRESAIDSTEAASVSVILWDGVDVTMVDRLVQLTGVEPEVAGAIASI